MPGGHAGQEAQGGSHRHGQPVGNRSSARSEEVSLAIPKRESVREGGVQQAIQEVAADVRNGVTITPLYRRHEQERVLPWMGAHRMRRCQLPHKLMR